MRITGAEISIPGQGTWVCATDQSVDAGQTLELFPEFYGDYGLTFEKPGHRSSGNAVIVVFGQHGALPVTIGITPGELPPSVLGGPGHLVVVPARSRPFDPDSLIKGA